MRRKLLLAMMAVGALSAIGSSVVQATEFDCGADSCRISSTPDGTGATAHHVLDVPWNGAMTCNQASFSSLNQPHESTYLLWVQAEYSGCTFLGQAAFVKMNGCVFTFNAHGGVEIVCSGGNKIEFGIPGCTGTVDSQFLSGIKDSGQVGLSLTVSANVEFIHMSMEGAACISTGTSIIGGRYTTGNTLIDAEIWTGIKVFAEWDTATSD